MQLALAFMEAGEAWLVLAVRSVTVSQQLQVPASSLPLAVTSQPL